MSEKKEEEIILPVIDDSEETEDFLMKNAKKIELPPECLQAIEDLKNRSKKKQRNSCKK